MALCVWWCGGGVGQLVSEQMVGSSVLSKFVEEAVRLQNEIEVTVVQVGGRQAALAGATHWVTTGSPADLDDDDGGVGGAYVGVWASAASRQLAVPLPVRALPGAGLPGRLHAGRRAGWVVRAA